MTATLTPARRRAIEVMAAIHPRPARVSNTTMSNTTTRTGGAGLVYWQSADWLVEQGLAQATDSGGLVLTAAGVAACADNGIEVRR
jgi:hypothetical protein